MSWLARLKSGLSKTSGGLTQKITSVFTQRKLDAATLEELEDILIAADFGAASASSLITEFSKDRFDKNIDVAEVQAFLATRITDMLQPYASPLPVRYDKKPQVILVVGVNGSGKTTTIGKLAAQYHATGRKVLVVAGDTFRAAAVAQLRVWAERAGVSVYTGGDQADVASVVFDGLQQALQQHADVVLIDTAGRLHNKDHLMQELAKVVRVMQKVMPDAPHDTVLVLDATTGQTAISQVALFREASPLTGLIVTKLDGTARGGIVVNLTQQFHLPIHAIGVGEHIDDLQVFDALAFARNLVGAGDST